MRPRTSKNTGSRAQRSVPDMVTDAPMVRRRLRSIAAPSALRSAGGPSPATSAVQNRRQPDDGRSDGEDHRLQPQLALEQRPPHADPRHEAPTESRAERNGRSDPGEHADG